MSLEDGIKALQQQQYAEAVQLLEDYCKHPTNNNSPAYTQAQIALARAYRGNNQLDKAFALGQFLQNHRDPEVNQWATGFISILMAKEKVDNMATGTGIITDNEKPLRTSEPEVHLPLPKAKFHLKLAYYLTCFFIFTIMLAFCFAFMSLIKPNNFDRLITLGITLIINLVIFLMSPLIMDFIQKRLYKIQWVNLSQIRKYSPEAATLISRVCRKKQFHSPRLGIIDDRNPIAFTYGVLPNKARIVITKGLLDSLTDEEIAVVYAHELGHIAQGNFAIMTVGATLIQSAYFFYLFLKNLNHGSSKSNKFLWVVSCTSIVPYLFYLLSNYLMFYLSRNREYFADHFAVEATGNPNGLSRALVKIAYGLLEEQKQATTSIQLIAMTRVLSIYDAKMALIPGTAYGLTSDYQQIGQIFLWDLFNPWGMWLGLNSSHPLMGKRIKLLMNYAQLLDIENQFNMIAIVVKGNQLNQSRLYGNFILEILIFNAKWLGMIAGIIMAFLLTGHVGTKIGMIGLSLVGFGGGMLLKTWAMYPKIKNPINADIYSLMCDPYASPLKGCPVHLQGKLIGQAESVYNLSSNIMLQESSGGIVFARYSSAFGALGNFFLSWIKTRDCIGSNVSVVGWFRRGVSPSIEWSEIVNDTISLRNYPRFWSMIRGGAVIIVGLIMLIYAIGTHRLTAN